MVALAAAAVVPAAQAVASPGAADATKVVRYHGVSVRVPTAWPVYDLAADPHQCVWLDVNAVYLGRPGGDQQCPAHLVGRSEAVIVAPGATDEDPAASEQTAGQVTRTFHRAGVHVTATFGRQPGLARQIAGSATDDTPAAPSSSSPSSPSSPALKPAAMVTSAPAQPRVAAEPSSTFIGNAFDTCSAPGLDTMNAWITSSPYRAANIYIGGAARACGDGNLSADWVTAVRGMGWRLIPTYVGLQAPCTTFNQRMSSDPATAQGQGTQAADDAIDRATFFGLPSNTPMYLDVENYDTTVAGCSSAVLAFVAGWTNELHAKGYLSGAYGSGSSLVTDLVAQQPTGYPEPDDLWFAHWNGLDSIYGDQYVPDTLWTGHHRIHQWHGGQTETYGGFAVNLDGDATDGQVVGPPGGTCLSYPPETYGPDGCSGGFSLQGSQQFWRLGAPNGLAQGERWTYGNGTTEDDGATWAPQLLAGTYDVSVWVPSSFATATLTYTIQDSGGVHVRVVDQSAHPNSYVYLGRYAGPPGGISVHVSDIAATSTMVGVDGMRFHYLPDYRYQLSGDFTGDGKADPAVFRPSTGTWWVRGAPGFRFGAAGDVPFVANFVGDKRVDAAVFRAAIGTWYIRGGGHFRFGAPGDIPLVGDFNGDGHADAAVFRPATGTWYVRGGGHFRYGARGDIPLVGDFTGDGRADAAVFRPNTGTWYVRGGGHFRWGTGGDIPLVGDFTGDGRADAAVFRPSIGGWWIRGVRHFTWGGLSDIPVVGDFNRDGRADATVFRPSTGTWWIRGMSRVTWGSRGDIPQ